MGADRKVNKLPMFATIGRSLYGALRALLWSVTGRLDEARGEALIQWWVERIFASGDAVLRAEGDDGLAPDASYLYMSNHTSLLDIPALLGTVPGRLRMVAKREVSLLPLFGPALRKMDFVFIDRADSRRAIRQLDHAKELLARGVSVWIAPEGTRTRTGKLGPFKKGGFHLAQQLGVPIVPVWIEGASDILAPDSFDVAWGGTVTVRFGRPIACAQLVPEDIPALVEQVRERILELSGRPREQVDGGERPDDKVAEGERCGRASETGQPTGSDASSSSQTKHDVAAA